MATRGRVVVLDGDYGVLTIREVELPAPGVGQALLQIDACGVEPRQSHQLASNQDHPTLPGCEASGRVIAVGEGVGWLAAGDTVLVSPFPRPLGGEFRPVTIETGDGPVTAPTGLFTFGTNALVDARYVYPLPRQRDHEACAVLGATILFAAAAVFSTVGPGSTVAVFGLGGGGQAIVAVARALAAGSIVAVDTSDARLSLAMQNGATAMVNARGEKAVAGVLDAAPRGVDLVFDSVFEYSAKTRPGTRALAPGGQAFLVGQPGSRLESERLAGLAAEYGYLVPGLPEDVPALLTRVLGLMQEGAVNPSTIVSNRYTIEGANEAMRDLEDAATSGAGIIVMEPLR